MADIGQHQQASFSVPADGSPAVATGVRANDNAIASILNAHDADHTIHVLTFADLASFPVASGRPGAVAVALDTRKVYVSASSAWTEVPYFSAIAASDIPAGTFAVGGYTFPQGLTVSGAKTTLAATVAGYASLNLPAGTAPTSPVNGDVWTTTAGVFVRINGATVGPLLGSGSAASLASLALTGTGPVLDLTGGTFTSTPAIKLPATADVAVSVRAGSGSIASGGSSVISWATEVADPKSLSTVGGGATNNAFNCGAYGGLWLIVVDFTGVVASSESAQVTVVGGIAGNIQLFGASAPGTFSSHFVVARLGDSTNVTVTVASTGGSGGITWTSARLTAVRLN